VIAGLDQHGVQPGGPEGATHGHPVNLIVIDEQQRESFVHSTQFRVQSSTFKVQETHPQL
jgi:hypothetical protein